MEFLTGTLTTALTVATSGTVMYVSADGKDRGLGSITNEDIVAVGEDFKLYKIEVVLNIDINSFCSFQTQTNEDFSCYKRK